MNIYDEALELINNGCDGPQAFDTYKIALERAKKVEELMLIYKQYYNGYLSPADQKRKQDLEKELVELK